jgi:DNA-binding transcriptional ArsR family regulator
MSEQQPSANHVTILRALADEDRLRIVRALEDGAKSVGELSALLGSPLANVSHHLKALRQAGVVTSSKRGRFVDYRLACRATASGDGHLLDFGECRIELGATPGDARLVARPDTTGAPPAADETLQRLTDILAPLAQTLRQQAAIEPTWKTLEGEIAIANPSFEGPVTSFFDTRITGWTKEGDPNGTGVFFNFPDGSPFPSSKRVVNAHGNQLGAIAATCPANAAAHGIHQMISGLTYEPDFIYTLSAWFGCSSVQPAMSDGDTPAAVRLSLAYVDGSTLRELTGVTVTCNDALAESPALDRLVRAACDSNGKNPPLATYEGKPIVIRISTAGNGPGHQGNFIFDDVRLVRVSRSVT